MKLSIIIAILNSHEVARRQVMHFRGMQLPDAVEILFMDDGSDPPLSFPDCLPNLRIYRMEQSGLWTQGIARMRGAQLARGEYILMTDIDHVISASAIQAALDFKGDKMVFPRQFAVLGPVGEIIQDTTSLFEFGLSCSVYAGRGLNGGFHGNTFLMRKAAWEEMGGYDHDRIRSGRHTMGEDREFNWRWRRSVAAGKYKPTVIGPIIYFYPLGRFHERKETNPCHLFHDSPRDDLERRDAIQTSSTGSRIGDGLDLRNGGQPQHRLSNDLPDVAGHLCHDQRPGDTTESEAGNGHGQGNEQKTSVVQTTGQQWT